MSDDGNTIFIGTDYKSHPEGITGSVNVYKRVLGSWESQSTIYPSDFSEVLNFGDSLDISNNFETIVVGSPNDINNMGVVYIFE